VRVAVVIGASGLVGRNLVMALAENPRYEQVICLDRRQVADSPTKISRRVIDFHKLSDLDLALNSDDEVDGYCCLGTTRKQAGSRAKFFEVDHNYVEQFAHLMWRYQAKHLSIVSSLGASPNSISHYAQTKGMMEASVRKIGLLSVSFLRPSLLLGKRDESRFLEDCFKPLGKLLVGPLAGWQGIEALDVAKAMSALAEQAASGHHIYPSLVIKQIANAY